MKERPIIFSAPMVRAILDGRKTQTRRIIKNPWADHAISVHWNSKMTDFDFVLPDQTGRIESCKYGKPGDRLWVRESWKVHSWDPNDGSIRIQHVSDNKVSDSIIIPESHDPQGEIFNKLWMQSSDDAEKAGIHLDDNDEYHWEKGKSPCRLRKGIFMPRWASRIDLEITRIRVERLQDISEQDAIAEGAKRFDDLPPIHPFGQDSRWSMENPKSTDQCLGSAKSAFINYWISLHGEKLWIKNPWVWVIEFKII